MGRPKRELKKIHRKKIRKAKEKLKAFSQGVISYQDLTQRAKKLLKKREHLTAAS